MNRILRISSAVGAVVVTGAFVMTAIEQGVSAQARPAAPAYHVTPFWPMPLPNHQVFGSITGVAVDATDHVWVVQRGADSLEGNEKGMMANPPSSSVCCIAAPFVMQFDAAGKIVSSFGGPGQGYQWPQNVGGIAADAKGNVWITAQGFDPAPAPARGRGAAAADGDAPAPAARGRGAAAAPGPTDAHVLKFSKSGQFILQIGTPGQTGPSETTLNRPHAVAVDSAANEVYVADTGNRRIVVFDSETGKFKRQWGGSGEAPGAAPGAYDPNGAAAKQFRDPTCVEIGKDGMVYVCDRTSDRIQVFSKDGKFVKEAVISKNTTGSTVTGQFGVLISAGSVWDIAFSNDAQQRYIFVADGQDKKIIVLDRATLAEIGTIGDGGRQPGRFLTVGSIAVDSKGNIYTGEQHNGKRVQRFMPGR